MGMGGTMYSGAVVSRVAPEGAMLATNEAAVVNGTCFSQALED